MTTAPRITDKEIEEYLKRKEARQYIENKSVDYDFRFIQLENLKSFLDHNPTYRCCTYRSHDLNDSFWDKSICEDNKKIWEGIERSEFFDKYVLVMNLEKVRAAELLDSYDEIMEDLDIILNALNKYK